MRSPHKGELPNFTVEMHSVFVQARIVAWFDLANADRFGTLIAVANPHDVKSGALLAAPNRQAGCSV